MALGRGSASLGVDFQFGSDVNSEHTRRFVCVVEGCW